MPRIGLPFALVETAASLPPAAASGRVNMVEIVCHTGRDCLVVELVGELSEVFAPLLRSCLLAAAESHQGHIVVDLGATTNVDEVILDTLADVRRSIDAGGVSLRVERAP